MAPSASPRLCPQRQPGPMSAMMRCPFAATPPTPWTGTVPSIPSTRQSPVLLRENALGGFVFLCSGEDTIKRYGTHYRISRVLAGLLRAQVG